MTNTNISIIRCQFQFSDGRNCRMLRTASHPSFCAFHAREDLQLIESQSLGTEISTPLNGDFLTATDINHVLGKLFTAVAQDRIPLRKAAVLTYLGQVMLSSLPHVKQEFPFKYSIDQWNDALNNATPLSDPASLTDSGFVPDNPTRLPDPSPAEKE